MFAGWKKGKRNRCPGYTTASRLMNTKPLCLSHLEIDRWKLLWYIYFPLAWIFILYFNHPHSHNFLMVHLTFRAEPPKLLSDRASEWTALLVRGCMVNPWVLFSDRFKGPGHPLFLAQTETRRAEKNFFEDRLPPPHYLTVWMTWTPPPPPLSQGLDPALLFTTQTITIRRLCCHSLQSWQGRGRGT